MIDKWTPEKLRAMADVLEGNERGAEKLQKAYDLGTEHAVARFRSYLLNRPLDKPGLDLDDVERYVRGLPVAHSAEYWTAML